MKLFTSFFVLFSLCIVAYCEKVSYENHRIYSIQVKNEKHLNALKTIESLNEDLLFLTPPSTQTATDILVPPQRVDHVEQLFGQFGIEFDLKTENVQRLIDDEQPDELQSSFGWTQYYSLSDIYAWLDELLGKYPNILTNYEYGKSYENRTLRAVKLSHNKRNPTIFIEANIHAREWVTSATTTFILNELLTSDNEQIKELAQNYNWVFVPVVNVDGFEYAHTTDRMWRKTRKPYGRCVGADPNRNFDIHHGESGASNKPCSETFAGPKPFSEIETFALSEFVKSVDNLKLYISFHSYTQILMFPYGFSSKVKAKNHDDMDAIARDTIAALEKRYGTKYKHGPISTAIYVVSGGSTDWVYDKVNVPIVFTYEFRDKGRYGFLLPPDQIIPNSLEVLDSLVALVNKAKSLKYL